MKNYLLALSLILMAIGAYFINLSNFNQNEIIQIGQMRYIAITRNGETEVINITKDSLQIESLKQQFDILK